MILHSIIVDNITLHDITLHKKKLHCITLNNSTLHYSFLITVQGAHRGLERYRTVSHRISGTAVPKGCKRRTERGDRGRLKTNVSSS